VEFWRRAIDALDFADLMQGFTKPVVFGFILATIGCYKGLTVRGGTQGVGRATTSAAVVGSVLIIVADAFLTKLSLYLSIKSSDARNPAVRMTAGRFLSDAQRICRYNHELAS